MDAEVCDMVGWVGFSAQMLLGAVAFVVLVFKRNQEHPQRPWKIWLLDTSKLGFSQVLAHFLNVWISISMPGEDKCLWYCTILIVDCTAGVGLALVSLRVVERVLVYWKLSQFQSGNYYESRQIYSDLYTDIARLEQSQHDYRLYFEITQPRVEVAINYSTWLGQFLIWNAVVILSKLLVLALELLFGGVLLLAVSWALGWLQRWPTLELLAVLFLIPMVLNAAAFWWQDNWLKRRGPEGQDRTLPE
jgi:hypothetical protein